MVDNVSCEKAGKSEVWIYWSFLLLSTELYNKSYNDKDIKAVENYEQSNEESRSAKWLLIQNSVIELVDEHKVGVDVTVSELMKIIKDNFDKYIGFSDHKVKKLSQRYIEVIPNHFKVFAD